MITTTTTRTVTVAPTDDAYTDSAVPGRNTGRATEVVASQVQGATKMALLKFSVPPAPIGGALSAAQLDLVAEGSLPAQVDLRRLWPTRWDEDTVTHATRVKTTDAIASVRPAAGSKSLSFDLRSAVNPGRPQSFAITSPAGTAALVSKEAKANGPRLVLTYKVTTKTVATVPIPVPTPPPAPTPTPPPPPAPTPTPVPVPVAKTGVVIGMTAPAAQWDARLAETGSVDGRRIFGQLGAMDSAVALARSEAAAGRMAILSFKVPGNDWTGVGRGKYDAQLEDLTKKLAAIDGRIFVTLHHEPKGDGEPAAYAAMMRHALPILGAPKNVDAGPIVNGFWWSKTAMGYTDAEIAQWLPADVLAVSEVVASDTYQGGDASKPGENAGVKIARMSAWADRVGVKRLGIGEYNGVDAKSITAAGDAILADPRYVFAMIYNSDLHNRPGIDWTLKGDRLEAFKQTVAKSRAARSGS